MFTLKNLTNLFPKQLIHNSHRFFHQSKPFSAPRKDLYGILGIQKGASQSEIKKAYYGLAQKYHPDKNPAPDAKEKFAEISNAYETLSDESKRKTYDAFGMTGDEQAQAGAGGPGGDPFGDFFRNKGGAGGFNFDESMFNDFESFFGGMGQKHASKGQDILLSMDISFEDAVRGAKKTVSYQRIGPCTTCHGSKCAPGTQPEKCGTCAGKGSTNFRQGPMTIQMVCGKCNGAGTIIKKMCGGCKGTGTAKTTQKEEITVPKGINSGQNLRVAGKGSAGENGGTAGDLIIKVNVAGDPYFKREGFDIYTDAYLTIAQAALGTTLNVKTLDGSQTITTEKGIQHGDKYKLPKMGVNKLPPNQNDRGDHYVVYKVLVPTNLTDAQVELFKKLAATEQKIDQEEFAKKNAHRYQNEKKQTIYGEEEDDEGGYAQDFEDLFGRFKNTWGGR